jgi:hypothetical protein
MDIATDGPWKHCKTALVIDIKKGWLLGSFQPDWVFRYTNEVTRTESMRIYVSIPGNKVSGYRPGGNPVPFLGTPP